MNGKLFLESLNYINPDYIDEAYDVENIKANFKAWDEAESEEFIDISAKNKDKEISEIPRTKTHKRRKGFMRLLLAAVISVSLLLAANFVAAAMGYDSLAILKEFGDRIVEMFEGERTEYKEITIIKEGERSVFTSVKSFFEKTEYDVLYPSKLPNNIKIKSVEIFDYKNNYTSDYKIIFFVSNKSPDYNVEVDLNPNADKYFLEDSSFSSVKINNFQCFYIQIEGVQCHFIYNNYVYCVKAPTYDDIVTIVSNMKEYEE